jgi:integrase
MGTLTAKKEARVKVAGWPGYVRGGVFVIEKRINTVKYHVSTRCTSLRAALKQLERFEESPSTYRPEGDRAVALVLDAKMIDDFKAWHTPQVSREWANNVKNVLVDWANHLKGSDLRSLSLIDDLKPHLVGLGQAHHRVKAIKILFKWLRAERGLITRAQDVTLDLAIPIIKPRQETGESKAVEFERLSAVLPHLAEHVRDVLEFLAVTGWHVSEVRRYADIGRFRPRDAGDPPDVLGVVATTHKDKGKRHFTNLLFTSHVELAQRIKARGQVLSNGRLRKHLLRACKVAGVKPFSMGDMRASVLTWLRLAGVPAEMAAAYVGHTSTATQERFYVDAEATKTVLPRAALRVVR